MTNQSRNLDGDIYGGSLKLRKTGIPTYVISRSRCKADEYARKNGIHPDDMRYLFTAAGLGNVGMDQVVKVLMSKDDSLGYREEAAKMKIYFSKMTYVYID